MKSPRDAYREWRAAKRRADRVERDWLCGVDYAYRVALLKHCATRSWERARQMSNGNAISFLVVGGA